MDIICLDCPAKIRKPLHGFPAKRCPPCRRVFKVDERRIARADARKPKAQS